VAGRIGHSDGAAVVWLWAFKLKKPGRVLIDPQNGETVRLTKKHTFFFIPMEYIALMMGVVALGILLFKQGSPL
jgi:hypothetical protein